MTFDEKIAFLKSYARLRYNLETYHEQIVNLELTMLPKGLNISDMPRRGGSDDPLADFGDRYYAIIKRVERVEAQMMRIVAAINQLESIDPVGHRLLTLQYIKGNRAREVERLMRISKNTRRKYHDHAIDLLEI